VLNRQRSWKRRYRFQSVALDESLRDDGPSPYQELESRERSAAICRAMARLSHERRSIVMLRDIEGLPYDDIATSLGISAGTVKSRLSRARADLRRFLTA